MIRAHLLIKPISKKRHGVVERLARDQRDSMPDRQTLNRGIDAAGFKRSMPGK